MPDDRAVKRPAPGSDVSIEHASDFWERGPALRRTDGDRNLARAVLLLKGLARPMISKPDLYFPQLEEIAEWLCDARAGYNGAEMDRRIEAIRASKTTTSISKTEAPPNGPQ